MIPISVEISTKDRYNCLSNCLTSILMQSYLPDELIISDDSSNRIDLRTIPYYVNIFNLLKRKGIAWRVVFGKGVGNVYNHQNALNLAKNNWIYRCDDDVILDNNCLANLVKYCDDNVGAIAPIVLHPEQDFENSATSPYIEDIFTKYAVNFCKFSGLKNAQHLYSSFLINRKAATNGYELTLSPACHREETIFTYNIFRNGFKLLACGDAVVWHMKAAEGGIRSYNNNPEFWHSDEQVFQKKLAEWGVKINKYKICHLNNGVGDHFCFKKILPEIRAKYPNHKIIISACYPDVFDDVVDCEIVNLNTGCILLNGETSKLDVYKFCSDNNWKGQLIDAFRKVYLNE